MAKAKVLGIYEHYKKGTHYRVLEIAQHTENKDEQLVIYSEVGKAGQVWARPRAMFEETITLEDGKVVDRFKYLGGGLD